MTSCMGPKANAPIYHLLNVGPGQQGPASERPFTIPFVSTSNSCAHQKDCAWETMPTENRIGQRSIIGIAVIKSDNDRSSWWQAILMAIAKEFFQTEDMVAPAFQPCHLPGEATSLVSRNDSDARLVPQRRDT